MTSVYQQWGFKNTPFETTALSPTPLGAQLLVGREAELTQLAKRIYNAPKLPTVEGANGVGKTSLVNISAYRLYQDYLNSTSDILIIPCRRPFQLKPETNAEQFTVEILGEVIQTLLMERSAVLAHGSVPEKPTIETWLTSTKLTALESKFGPNPKTGSSVNLSNIEKYGKHKEEILEVLREIFSGGHAGGIVCIIDNMEILQESDIARKIIEELRDPILTATGIRFVLCGAAGIIRSVVASPRLEGFLHAPIELTAIKEEYISQILPSRIKAYTIHGRTAYLPLLPVDFERLYKILRGNLRASLSYADAYCMGIADGTLPTTDEEKKTTFQKWLDSESQQAYASVIEKQLTPRAVKVFRRAVSLGGSFSPSDFAHFDFNNIESLRKYVKQLEELGVFVSLRDDVDRRRKTITITPKGWLAEHALQDAPLTDAE